MIILYSLGLIFVTVNSLVRLFNDYGYMPCPISTVCLQEYSFFIGQAMFIHRSIVYPFKIKRQQQQFSQYRFFFYASLRPKRKWNFKYNNNMGSTLDSLTNYLTHNIGRKTNQYPQTLNVLIIIQVLYFSHV